MDQINLSIKNHTWLIVLIAITFSFIFPQFGNYIKPLLNPFLMAMMFLSCLDLNPAQIFSSLKDIPQIILMLLIVHLISPVLIFLFKGYFTDSIFLGLIIAGTIPAGRSSVFLSNIYGGTPIKALVSTSISALFSPITVPIFVWLFAKTSIKIDPLQMSSTIIYLVAIPLLIALFIGKTKTGQKINHYSTSLSTILLFLIIIGIISPLKHIVFQNLGLTLTLGLIITSLIIINFFLGYLLGQNRPDKITYAISSSYKNYTLGTILSLTVFTPTVALPSIIYAIVSNLLLIPLQLLPKSSK